MKSEIPQQEKILTTRQILFNRRKMKRWPIRLKKTPFFFLIFFPNLFLSICPSFWRVNIVQNWHYGWENCLHFLQPLISTLIYHQWGLHLHIMLFFSQFSSLCGSFASAVQLFDYTLKTDFETGLNLGFCFLWGNNGERERNYSARCYYYTWTVWWFFLCSFFFFLPVVQFQQQKWEMKIVQQQRKEWVTHFLHCLFTYAFCMVVSSI